MKAKKLKEKKTHKEKAFHAKVKQPKQPTINSSKKIK